MPQAHFQSIGIEAVVTAVPTRVERLDELAGLYHKDPSQLERLRKVMQLEQRHIAPTGMTTLDLCEQAARTLIAETSLDPSAVDAIICVTQTPDHLQPCNANILHGRLGLGKNAAAFDVNQGCSGWVYGLYLAATLLAAGGCRSVLLLAGDTISRLVHPQDKACRPLFGDAGSATWVRSDPAFGESWFSLHSDGRGWQAIQQPGGGFRQPVGSVPDVAVEDTEGNLRGPCNLHMNGLEVFNFTLREEPAALRSLLQLAGVSADAVDYFVLHQANAFILSNLAKRLQLPLEKVPMRTAGRYGNQSSASIPGTLCHELGPILQQQRSRLVFSGFGVGLSWASALMQVGPRCLTRLIEVDGG